MARRLLFPGRCFLHRSFSSALPYRVDGQVVVTVLRPQLAHWLRTGRALANLSSATGELVYELRPAGSLGQSRTVGLLAAGIAVGPRRALAQGCGLRCAPDPIRPQPRADKSASG